jgi:hypothetical protein
MRILLDEKVMKSFHEKKKRRGAGARGRGGETWEK